MLTSFIVTTSLVALLVDYYIWRRMIVRYRLGACWKWGYLAYAAVADFVIVAAILVYRASVDRENPGMLHVVSWIIAFFFMNVVPKLLYAVVSLFDYVAERFTRKRSHLFGRIGAGIGLAVLGCMVWGATAGRSRVQVREVEITSERVPPAFDGYRIVQFSDVHIGTMIRPEKMLPRLVAAIGALQPDMVVETGDIVNIHAGELSPEIRYTLSGIRARDGVFAVMGNHDLGFYIHDTTRMTPAESCELLRASIGEMGWRLLVNESAVVRRDGEAISVSGINYPSKYSHTGWRAHIAGVDLAETYGDLPDSTFNIMLTHTPQVWDAILAAGRSDLTLAGHVHSMQIKIRIGRWAWSPARYMYARWSGLYEEGGKYLYVNDGIGYVMFPMRIGTPPEVTLITLRNPRLSDPAASAGETEDPAP